MQPHTDPKKLLEALSDEARRDLRDFLTASVAGGGAAALDEAEHLAGALALGRNPAGGAPS